jgi:sigma-B regulation protein RsbU (phosphoserine phosphatase)
MKIDSGDSLILYTDGLTEIDRRNPDTFNEQSLAEFIKGTKDLGAEDIASNILDAYFAILNDRARLDDVTILVAKLL